MARADTLQPTKVHHHDSRHNLFKIFAKPYPDKTEQYLKHFKDKQACMDFFSVNLARSFSEQHDRIAAITEFLDYYAETDLNDTRSHHEIRRQLTSEPIQQAFKEILALHKIDPYWTAEQIEGLRTAREKMSNVDKASSVDTDIKLKMAAGKSLPNAFEMWAGLVYYCKKRHHDKQDRVFYALSDALRFYQINETEEALKHLRKVTINANLPQLSEALKNLHSNTDDPGIAIKALEQSVATHFAQAEKAHKQLIRVLQLLKHPIAPELSRMHAYRCQLLPRIASGDVADDSYIRKFVNAHDELLDIHFSPAYYTKAMSCLRAGQFYIHAISHSLMTYKALDSRMKSGKDKDSLKKQIRDEIEELKSKASQYFLDTIYHFEIAIQTYNYSLQAIHHAYYPYPSIANASSLTYSGVLNDVESHLKACLEQSQFPVEYPNLAKLDIIKNHMGHKAKDFKIESLIEATCKQPSLCTKLELDRFILEYNYRDVIAIIMDTDPEHNVGLKTDFSVNFRVDFLEIQMQQRRARKYLLAKYGIGENKDECDYDIGSNDQKSIPINNTI